MQTDKIMDEISSLPPEGQRQVEDFIAFLRTKYAKTLEQEPNRHLNSEEDPFIGMWKGRPDMEDSGKWLRSTRKSEWDAPDA